MPKFKENGISKATVYREAADGKIQLVKVRGSTMVMRVEFNLYMRSLKPVKNTLEALQ